MASNSLEIIGKLALIQPPDVKRPILVRLRRPRKGILSGVVQNNTTGSATPDELPIDSQSHIICVFPSNPPYGKAYNILVEPYEAQERLKPWGIVTYYRKLSKTERRNFQRGMQRAGQRLRQLKLNYMLPIDLEVRQPKGKMAGRYVALRGDGNHHIEICPVSFVADGGAKVITRIGLHESGHPLWRLYMPDNYKARWIQLYHGFNKIRTLNTNDLHQQLRDFSDARALPSAYRKDLTDDTKVVFDAILDWIKKTHHLEIKFLDILVNAGNRLDKYWPRTALHLSELIIPVTSYSAKNAEELFCEALSLYGMKTQLPRLVRSLVRRTLRKLQPR